MPVPATATGTSVAPGAAAATPSTIPIVGRTSTPASRAVGGQAQPTVVVPRGGVVPAGDPVTVTLHTKPRAAVSITVQLLAVASPPTSATPGHTKGRQAHNPTAHSSTAHGAARKGAGARGGRGSAAAGGPKPRHGARPLVYGAGGWGLGRSSAPGTGRAVAALDGAKGPTPSPVAGGRTTKGGKGQGTRGGHGSAGNKGGAGSKGKGAARPVVLYQTTVRARADARGRVAQRVRLAYYPAKAVAATLVVTIHTPLGASTRRTRVTITPLGHHRFR